jgi:hypothetical protein
MHLRVCFVAWVDETQATRGTAVCFKLCVKTPSCFFIRSSSSESGLWVVQQLPTFEIPTRFEERSLPTIRCRPSNPLVFEVYIDFLTSKSLLALLTSQLQATINGNEHSLTVGPAKIHVWFAVG